MKKLLALTVALALACALWVPALAAEPYYTVDVADLEPMDPAFIETSLEEEPPSVAENDPVEEYMAAHPDEMAALDYDALLAGWGYLPPRDAFMEAWGYAADTFEEAVQLHYADNRVYALQLVGQAEEYKAQYPEAWAAFDADAYLEEAYGLVDYGKAALMAEQNLLTDEELNASLFVKYVDGNLQYDYETDSWIWVAPEDWGDDLIEPEPTLTLVVNGQTTDVVLTAENWVTSADAGALRDILGAEAVPADLTGPVPVRQYAQAAGWDVVWYDGGWSGYDRQVCLWDREVYTEDLEDAFGPAQALMERVMDLSMEQLQGDTLREVTETAKVTVTQFSTLDGDKTYPLTITATGVMGQGKVDLTLEADWEELLALVELLDPRELLEEMKGEGVSLDDLAGLNKMELLMDYRTGEMAVKAPALALLIPEEYDGEWVTQTVPDFPQALEGMEELDLAQMGYQSLLDMAEISGGVEAQADLTKTMEAVEGLLGPDHFTEDSGGRLTYTLTTRQMNDWLSARAAQDREAPAQVSWFKECDISLTVDKGGSMTVDMALRPDVDGIVGGLASGSDPYPMASMALRGMAGALDARITVSGQGDLEKATETVELHWNNRGVLRVETSAASKETTRRPRAPRDVGEWQELEDLIPAELDLGVIGGQDGPTEIVVTPAP